MLEKTDPNLFGNFLLNQQIDLKEIQKEVKADFFLTKVGQSN